MRRHVGAVSIIFLPAFRDHVFHMHSAHLVVRTVVFG